MSEKLYIRADGNSEIATGHIMRCLSIAKAARKKNIESTFVLADPTMQGALGKEGFESVCLNSDWKNLDCETEAMADLVSTRKIKNLLIDSYFISSNYLSALNKRCDVAYLDDLNAFSYPCKTLINYIHQPEFFDYRVQQECDAMLIGSRFAPLREEFENLPLFEVQPPRKVLVTTGGSDRYNIAGELIQQIMEAESEISRLEYHLVVGSFNTSKNLLAALSEKYPNVILYENVENMSELMRECDMAVSAGGGTLFELCACGLPSVFFIFADNQKDAIKTFADEYMIFAGDARLGKEECIQRVYGAVCELAANEKLRRGFSRAAQGFVDGKGARRIVEALFG